MTETLDLTRARKALPKRLQRLRMWCATTTSGSARWQSGVVAAIAALVIAPQASVDAGVGLDPSWEAAVALARIQHIAWGPGLVFTYGPLGYLQTTAYYAFDQSVLATVYQFVVVAGLFLGVTAALRQRCAPMISIIGAFATTYIAAILQVGHGTAYGMMYPELAVLAALAWAAVPMLQQDPKRSTGFCTCIVVGAVAGLQLLVKFNTGLTTLIIALAASLLLGWKALGRHGATVTSFAASTLICWVVAGQRLGDLPVWVKFSTAILSGYNASQAVPLTPNAGPAILLSLGWIGALGVMFVRGGREIPRSLVVLVGVLTIITVKSSFGRFDIWHLSMLLGVIVVAVAIMPVLKIWHRALAVGAVALIFGVVGGGPVVYDRAVTALQAPVQGANRLFTLVVPGRVEQRIQQAKARQRAIYAVPPRFIETIGSKTVHVDPDETSVVWAYNLAWRPAPVFPTYSAYTPALDKLNSDTLVDGPEFVLSRVSATSPATGIDGRLATQESPLYTRALLCNYAVSGVENHWALFTRTAPHCGPLIELSEIDVGKEPVTVPLPSGLGMAVLVGLDLRPTIIDRLFQGTIVPLTAFTAVLDGVSYRLIADNAAEPFLVVTPAAVNGTNLEIQAHTIGVGRTQALGQRGVRARLRFFGMRVTPLALAG
jgi:hypothetical protein